MKQKIKRHYRSAVSVLLSVCMLISCMTVGLIATDAARVTEDETIAAQAVDDETVGAGERYLWIGTSDNSLSYVGQLGVTSHRLSKGTHYINVTRGTSNWYTDYEWWESNNNTTGTPKVDVNGACRISFDGVQSYNIGGNSPFYLRMVVSKAGDYNFTYNSGTHTLAITGGDASADVWTALGDSKELFGTTWSKTAAENEMVKSGDRYVLTKTNVSLSAGTIQYKVIKDHDYSSGQYPTSGNASQTVSNAGVYNVRITYSPDATGNKLTMTLTPAAKHKLTVPSVEGAAVKATYDGRTAQEGEDLTDIPVGATVNITVTPDTIGKTCTAVTPDPTATVTGSGKNWNLIMPDADATFSVTLGDVELKRVYYNNYYTRYAMVTAYAQYDSGEEPLGSGVTMTKIANTNTWYVEVPGNVNKITFRSGSGATTGAMIIQWSEYNNKPKYTGVLAEDPSLTATKPGYWGEYNERPNEYTVSKGSTLNDNNLFTGIKATFYDYYTDNEVDNGWLNIANNEYSGGTDWKWNPYKKLNSALSKYAADYSVSRPLYFGNLNTADINTYGNSGFDAKATIEAYTGWNLNANNSGALTTPHNAVMALSGTTLAQSNIHYYKSGATNENGHEMALFDEDFLSGENNQHKPIAAILRSSAFPVRKTTVASGYNQIFLDNTSLTWYDESLGNALTAHFWDSSNTSDYIDVVMRPVNQSNSHLFVVDKVDPKYDKVRFDRVNSGNGNRSNMTKDYDVPANNNSSCRLYLWDHLDDNKAQGDWRTCDSAINATGGAEYYEFDSSGGKDNAYIESIDTTNKTANLEYYDDQKVRSSSKAQGFFPYDKAQASATGTTAHDLGFGMKLEIPFTINQNGTVDGTVNGTHQVFNFSGDDDLWVFIDNKLVLDLGGAHAKTTGSIDFNTKTVTAVLTQMSDGVSATRNGSFSWFDTTGANAANTPHTMTIYYTERGMYDSNLKFGFSFHPIPNQFKVEKKVRTKGDKDLGILNINSGFFQDNGETEGAAASNKSTALSTREGRFISKFEESFQSEQFTFTQTYTNATTPATGTALPYTLHKQDGTLTSKTVTPDSDKTMVYTLKNDEIAHFVKQFVKGDTFTLKETADNSNKYRYTPQLVVYDDARLDDNGNEYKFVSGNPENDGKYSYNSTTGVYTFKFNETVASGLDNTNIRARFENHMKYHDLTLKKVVDDPSDTDSEFTFEFKFDFDFKNVKNYIAYPLDVTVLNPNGTVDESDGKSKLSVKDATHEAGRITIKAGQTITLPQIPEMAKVQITEIINNDTGNYTYDSTSVKYDNGTDVENPETIDNGVRFVMGSRGINAIVSNSKRKLQITHSLHPDSLGDASCYLKVEVQKNSDSSVEKTYGNTTTYAEPVDVDADYLRYNSTNKLVITLTTTVTDPTSYTMEHFYEKLQSTINLLSGLGSPFDLDIHDTAPAPYATITVPISGLFDSTTHAQKYTILPFYSKVIDAGKDVKIYKKITSGTSSKKYTMFIKTITDLDDDNNPADYSGTYTIKNVSDDAVVGTANQTYSSSGVSITPEQYILLEKVRLDTKLQITEKELSSDYARAFHYDYTSVKVGSADAKTTKDNGGITASTDPKKIDNGVRFTVSDDTNVDIYNKAWTYRILYKYPGYLSRYYTGAHIVQTYTMTGDFKDEDFDETTGRMTIGRTTSGSSAETYPCAMFKGYDDAEYPYKTTEDTVKNFITSQAPYEDNFMTSMTWNPNLNPNDTSKERTTIEYFPLIDGQHVNIETSADTNPNDTIHVYFRLPYHFDALNKTEGTGMDPIYNDQGKIVKEVPTNYRVTTQYAHWFTKNGLFTEEENSKWVQAPAEIYDTNGTKYVFRHWSMVSVGKDLEMETSELQNVRLHEKKDEYEYKRCYNNKFNMTLYQDTYVEPVYILESNDPTYENDASLSPAERETKDTTQVKYGGAIINFLENSRNQWNHGGGSLYSSRYENIPGRENLGDRVFSDFLLSFNYNDLMLKSPLGKYKNWTEVDPETGEEVEKKEFVPYLCKNNEIYHEYGFLLEVVDNIQDENNDGKIDSDDILNQEAYRNKYNSQADGTNPEAYTQMVAAVNFLDAGTAVSSDGPFIVKSTKKASGLDNKNEVEYSSSLPLINHTSGESTGRNLKVFRAYAYLKDYNLSSTDKSDYTWNGEAISDNEFAALSSSSHEGKVLQISKPVYFTIFNIASVANGTPFDDKGGQS